MANRSISRFVGICAVVVAVAILAPACGSGNGSGTGTGQGLVLVTFHQAGVDNFQLNNLLVFEFSSAVDPASINPASIQIREGNSFGATAKGSFEVDGATVRFRPQLPGLCDLSDSGFFAGTTYRVQIVGWPDEFAVRNASTGQHLDETSTWEFATRESSDPEKFQDQIPGAAPVVDEPASFPLRGTAAVAVANGQNQISLVMSENLDPCTVTEQTVLVNIYERGDPATGGGTGTDGVLAANGNFSGFYSSLGANPDNAEDQDPTNDFTWWSGNEPGGVDSTPVTGNKPQVLPATVALEQTFTETKIVISPNFRTDPSDPTTAILPDNALIVVQLTFGIQDYGGQPLAPFTMSFTTEKQFSTQTSDITLTNERDVDTGETVNPVYLANGTTARIDGDLQVVQGYLLFAGDGDNGQNQLKPSLPQSDYPGCVLNYQTNDGAKDDFDPAGDVTLDTGPKNSCLNSTDGSTAVVWEFNDFRIRGGVTVRVMGANPAIILAQQAVTIETGGRLLVRGDGSGGTPQSNGKNGQNTNSGTAPAAAAGGKGVAGAGDGGSSKLVGVVPADDGFSGFGSDDYDPITGVSVKGGQGTGHGNASADKSTFAGGGNSPSGGGGGHSQVGVDGTANLAANLTLIGVVDGVGGGVYGDLRMFEPEAGAGGGAAGFTDYTQNTFSGYDSTGGAGAAGGGFVDLTSQGEVNIFGTIDASGARGGGGAAGFYVGAGGGGGGSGGGIRVLTPFDINVAGAVITAAGGQGGPGAVPTSGTGTTNAGGAGGAGRVVLEDDDSVITGLGAANITPCDGQDGFYRGIFDASRFKGGGLEPQALTEIQAFGPLNPVYVQPVQADFLAGIPPTAGGVDVSMVIEARAYQMRADGKADTATGPTEYATIGYFTDSGNPTAPLWNDAAIGLPSPADWMPTGDNTRTYHQMTGLRAAADATFGAGVPIPFIQFRITFILPPGAGPFDPGPFIDDWTVHVDHLN